MSMPMTASALHVRLRAKKCANLVPALRSISRETEIVHTRSDRAIEMPGNRNRRKQLFLHAEPVLHE